MSQAGTRYHFVDEGTGEVLLMVHGNPTWSFLWRNLIIDLRAGFRAVAPDHIGCGLSDKPTRYPYTLKQHTANLVDFIDHLDLRDITLLAHDWGGPIGLGAALARRERFARFVLFNTGAFPPPFIPWQLRLCRTPVFGRLAVQGMNMFARGALHMAVSGPAKLSRPVAAGFLAPYRTWRDRAAIYQFVKDIPACSSHPTWPLLEQLEAELPALAHQPCQLVWGVRDWCFRTECLERLHSLLPGAEVHRLDAGHWVTEEAQHAVLPLVKSFVDRHGAARASDT
jgi:haloalkane dehalogenase